MTVRSSEELCDMIKLFRVKELADLLSFAKLSKKGLKSELVKKCLQLPLDKEIRSKIESLAKGRRKALYVGVSKQNVNSVDQIKSTPSKPTATSTDKIISHKSTVISPIKSTPTRPTAMCADKIISQKSTEISPIAIPNFMETLENKTEGSKLEELLRKKRELLREKRELLRSRDLAFSKEIQNLEFEELRNQFGNASSHTLQHCTLVFHLESHMLIKKLVDGKFEYRNEIHIRFGYENSQKDFLEDCIPTDLHMTVNGLPAKLPEAKKNANPNAGINRIFRTIDISILCKKNTNLVKIFWKNPIADRIFHIDISLVEKVGVDQLMQHLSTKCVDPEESTIQMVKSKLQTDDSDFEIETNTLNISLKCPLMGSRITLPGRAVTCKHVQCFDLKSYLSMNENKPTWNCPVCSQSAPYDTLRVDSLFQRIITELSSALEIAFQKDGSWTSTLNTSKQESGYNSDDEGMDIDESPDDSAGICIDLCDDSSAAESRQDSIIDLT